MAQRKDKITAIHKEMEKKSASYAEHVPTMAGARVRVEQKRAAEREKQKTERKTVRPASQSPKHSSRSTNTVKRQVAAKKKKPQKKKSTGNRVHRKKEMSTKKLILIIALIILSITGITSGILFALSRSAIPAAPLSLPVKFVVEQGETAAVISENLVEAGIIQSAEDFLSEVENREAASALREGFYYFTEGTSPEDIVSTLTDEVIDITLYPGESIAAIDERLSSRYLIQPGDFIAAMEEVAEERYLPFTEGFLAGNLYEGILRNSLALSLARRGVDGVYALIRNNAQKINESPFSIAELLIMASMIQRETNNAEQMPLIAGVIMNRLERGEPLGIDATTRYAVDDWEHPLDEQDFAASGVYDTRRRKGLPPSGIGAVSASSFAAVLSPAVHDYLFYLHSSDGSLQLSETYKEHLEKAASLEY